jgi:hypothetical protein
MLMLLYTRLTCDLKYTQELIYIISILLIINIYMFFNKLINKYMIMIAVK